MHIQNSFKSIAAKFDVLSQEIIEFVNLLADNWNVSNTTYPHLFDSTSGSEHSPEIFDLIPEHDITVFKMHNFLKMYATVRGRRKRSPPKGGRGDGVFTTFDV